MTLPQQITYRYLSSEETTVMRERVALRALECTTCPAVIAPGESYVNGLMLVGPKMLAWRACAACVTASAQMGTPTRDLVSA